MESSPLVISYKSKLYDLSKFQHKHPGGINTLKGLHNTDIRQRFENSPPHSDAALYLMKEYEIGHTTEANINGNVQNGMPNGTKNGIKNGNLKSQDINSNIQYRTDESMEVSTINSNREINVVKK